MNHQEEESVLFNTVVKGGYCIGCGACSGVNGSPVKMKLDEHARFVATLPTAISKEIDERMLSVCPFSNKSLNENVLGAELFGKEAVRHDKIGYVIQTYAGYVASGNFRQNGSSGGMGSWIACTLLERGYVDGIIHVHQHSPTNDEPTLFRYQLSTDIDDVLKGAKSRYYPVELSNMINLLKSRPGKYAIVGLPCFIKSLRLLSKHDAVLNERIKFCIGLVCGHLKSAHFASMWAWQNNVHPKDLKEIDFRTKLSGFLANQYGVTVSCENNGRLEKRVSPPLGQLYGSNWGWGFFKYKACDYCDDVVAETADVTIGDAWLPRYVNDSQGTNIIIIRNKIIEQLFNDARNRNEIHLDTLSPEEVVLSQRSGFEHRREGLSYRLLMTDIKNEWRPTKRVLPLNGKVDKPMMKKQCLRVELATKSHTAFQKALKMNDFEVFKRELNPILIQYKKLYQKPLVHRIAAKLFRAAKKLIKQQNSN